MDLQTWLRENFLNKKAAVKPFSFIYHGRKSADLLPGWNVEFNSQKISETKTAHVITYQDPKTNIQLTCELTEYADFPALEWVLHFKNNGSADTPILENILPLDTTLTRRQDKEFALHRILGSLYDVCEYRPIRVAIQARDQEVRLGLVEMGRVLFPVGLYPVPTFLAGLEQAGHYLKENLGASERSGRKKLNYF